MTTPPRYGRERTDHAVEHPDALDFPATARNREPIWQVLEPLLPATGRILEVGSGSGQHICEWALRRPALQWLPSNPEEPLNASVRAWRAVRGAHAVAEPLLLDLLQPWPLLREVAGVVVINVLHVSPAASGEALWQRAAELLAPGGWVLLYGPFQRNGEPMGPGNASFHASLQAQQPAWGLRHLEAVVAQAAACGLSCEAVHEMPAHNLAVTLRRGAEASAGRGA